MNTTHQTDQTHRTPRPRTAVEVFDRAKELLLAHDMLGFADLWAADGTMEFPFAPPGRPSRLEGREAVREYLRDYTDLLDARAVTHDVRHRTEDPNALIVEWAVEGIAVRTGRPYRMAYVAFITVEDGEITSYRDYWNPLAAGQVLGILDELTAVYAGGRADG
ncbi:nuclear transport factor 2 family protein [Streptomyces sp. NPDC059679]|uniref:nuclear transport factor 2 family protein n=1 Tax=Streptomyces sp. NPDC059679 TaxID=3346903 RepID=UPI0036BEC4BB